MLRDGAELLARSTTYAAASFGLQVGGGSAGLNAKPDDRPAALAASNEASEARRVDAINQALLDRVNASGSVYLSHTRLDGKFTRQWVYREGAFGNPMS